jgi:hypothetical protein
MPWSAAALALASDGLYVGGNRFLAKFRPDGEQDWLAPVPESEIIDIAVANDGALALIARLTSYQIGPTQLGPCAIARPRAEAAVRRTGRPTALDGPHQSIGSGCAFEDDPLAGPVGETALVAVENAPRFTKGKLTREPCLPPRWRPYRPPFKLSSMGFDG